jgi:hypothetical protein
MMHDWLKSMCVYAEQQYHLVGFYSKTVDNVWNMSTKLTLYFTVLNGIYTTHSYFLKLSSTLYSLSILGKGVGGRGRPKAKATLEYVVGGYHFSESWASF